ncbi:MAG: YadA-like family protein [Pararobbsia sp.]
MNHSTVGSALSNLDGRVKTNTDSIAEINAALEAGTGTGGPARAVTYDDDAKGIVSFAGASGTRLTNVAAGSITAGSTDAVNGGQIASLAQSFNAKLDGLDVRVTSLESNAGTGGGNGGNGGSSSVVDGPNGATSIGVGSALPQDYALSVGAPGSERRITNVAVGTAGTDAVNLNQLNAARDSAIQQSNSYTDLRFHQSQARVNDVARTAYSGVAMAMAMPNISPAKPGSTVVAAGTGGFQGYGAFGLGVTYRSPNGQVLVNGAVAYSNSGGAATRVQVGYEF